MRVSIERMAAKVRDRFGKPDQHETTQSGLLDQLKDLNGEHLDGVARAIALLWDDFVETSGGPDVFRSAGDEERREYVAKIRHIAGPYEASPSKRLYALAANAMASFVELLARPDLSTGERELSRFVVSMIDRGRTLRTNRLPEDQALSPGRPTPLTAA